MQLLLGLLLATVIASRAGLAKPPIPTPLDTPVVGELDDYLLRRLYESKSNDSGLAAIVDSPDFKRLIDKHNLRTLGGPILGCVTSTSARFWIRTPGPRLVQVVVADRTSRQVKTGSKNDFVALLDVDGLAPNTKYAYDVLVDGTSAFENTKPEFQTYPTKDQPHSVTVAFGGGARYNPKKEFIWDIIDGYQPDAMLMLGDNVYIDQPRSRTKQRVHYYRRQARPEFRRLTASTAMYAIYDDHDLGNNDFAGGPAPFQPTWKYESWKVFRENWNNPGYGGESQWPGCWFRFSIGGVEFFMLDNRYYRSFKDGTMLGPVQKRWLLKSLKESTARFKAICSGTLWTEHADKGGRDSWWGVQQERDEIFDFIAAERIGGVILLSADRHRSDVYRIKRPSGYDLYEFESSKLTNDHTHPQKPEALFSYNEGNFFGLLKFDIQGEDSNVTFQCITAENRVVHELTLELQQLRVKP